MATRPEFKIQINAALNLIRLHYLGRVTATGMKACRAEVEGSLPGMRAGFTMLTDLSGLESMDLDCVPHLAKIMDLCRVAGIGTVVRIIPDRTKDIGFNILSAIHYRRGVRVVTCETLAEAEQTIKPSVK